MHWINKEEFTYNDYADGNLISYAFNFDTGGKRKINGAIAAVSPNHNEAIGLNFHRMSFCRKTVGYAHDEKEFEMINIPSDDGLYRLDLKTGKAELFLSIKDVIERADFNLPQNRPAWFNHVLYSVDGERILFFCRIRKEKKGFLSSLWTIKRDGTELQCEIPFDYWVSHFDWKDEKTILVTSDIYGKREYMEFEIGKRDFKVIGKDILTVDGHCSYLPNRNCIISDTYNLGEERLAELFLFNIEKNRKVSLGKFHHDAIYRGVIRCDLHPRVSESGTIVSFDSVYEGSRQIYTVDISGILG